MKATVHVFLKPGVLDVQGKAVEAALHGLGWPDVANVRIGRVIEFDLLNLVELPVLFGRSSPPLLLDQDRAARGAGDSRAMAADPTALVERPRLGRRLPKALSFDDVEKLLAGKTFAPDAGCTAASAAYRDGRDIPVGPGWTR